MQSSAVQSDTTMLRRLLKSPWLRRNMPLLVVYGLLLALVIFGTVAAPGRFFTDRNLFNVLRQAAFLGTLALGEMLVILTGGIDLSVGSVVKLTMMVAAILMDGKSENIGLGVLGTLGLGVVIGLVHALIITKLNVAPFIVTLGTYSIVRSIALAISTGPIGKAAPEVLRLYDQRVAGSVPVLVILFAILLLLAVLMLRRTPFGRYIYAVGGSEQVARLSGIPINRVKFGVYILCSVLASLAGLLYLSRSGIGDPATGDGLELQAITAVILGGTSLFGGRGSVIGTLGGVLLIGLTNNMLVVLNATQWYQELIQGVIIVAAVALYKQKGRQ